MATSFKRSFIARWSDTDFNGHMRSTAFLDVASDVRLLFFSENGYSLDEFKKQNIGPVHLKDEIIYFKEIKLLEKLEVQLLLSGISEDGTRFSFKNYIFKKNGKIAAQITSKGAWFDLTSRSLITPPKDLYGLLNGLERSDDFEFICE